MDLGKVLDWAERQAAGRDVVQRLERIVPGFSASDVIKLQIDRAIVAGDLDGQPVIAKWYRGGDGPETVRRLRAELDHLSGHMSSGPCRMMRCLGILPEHGLAILDRVPGDRLTDVLPDAEGPERARLVALAARWLGLYTAGRRREAAFGPRHWLDRRHAHSANHLDPADADLARALLDGLEALVPSVRGQPVTKAAVHGDFTSDNLIWDGEVLTGVDVQGECWLPLAKDMALFLVWQVLRRDRETGARHHGVWADDWSALAGAHLLETPESETVLRFLIGCELHFQFLRAYPHETQRDRLAEAIRAWLSESDQPSP
jgi:hypothetical protein